MNIFVLDEDPRQAAKYHCDKHVVKMILESAQVLSAIHRKYSTEVNDVVYKTTHPNHPCTLWAAKTTSNYEWLYSLYACLCGEYRYRYYKQHKTTWLLDVLSMTPDKIPKGKLTRWALAMPLGLHGNSVVESYRNYYHTKTFPMSWTRRGKPHWYTKD